MKKGILLSLILTLFYIFSLHGQGELHEFYSNYRTLKANQFSSSIDIEGSPYENTDFMQAEVWMNGSEKPVIGKMRYSSFQDEMEFQKENGDTLILMNKFNLDSIHLDNQRFRYLTFIEDKTISSSFFVQLTNGECKLFKKIRKSYQAEKHPTTSFDLYVPAAFVKEPDEFYVSFNDQPLLEIPQRDKKIKEMLRENGYVNKKISRVKYDEESLLIFFRGLNKLEK